MNSPWDPNPSTLRTAPAFCASPICLPLRGLLSAGAPAWNTWGSLHPIPQNLQTQWVWSMSALDHGEENYSPVCPDCHRNHSPCHLNLDPHSVGAARGLGGVENSKKTELHTQANSASLVAWKRASQSIGIWTQQTGTWTGMTLAGKQKSGVPILGAQGA